MALDRAERIVRDRNASACGRKRCHRELHWREVTGSSCCTYVARRDGSVTVNPV